MTLKIPTVAIVKRADDVGICREAYPWILGFELDSSLCDFPNHEEGGHGGCLRIRPAPATHSTRVQPRQDLSDRGDINDPAAYAARNELA